MASPTSAPVSFSRHIGRAFPGLVFLYASFAAAVGMVTIPLARRLVDLEPAVVVRETELSTALAEAVFRPVADAYEAVMLFVLLIPATVAVILAVSGMVIWAIRVLVGLHRIAGETKEET